MSETAVAERAAFTGFTPQLFDFFDALAANQNREWFQANRDSYERHCRAPMAAFVDALAFAFAVHEIPLTGSAKESLFRVNRDTRFSKDKRPYKTNIAAVLTRDGVKGGKGVFYISLGGHGVERGGMLGAGFYGPDGEDLARMRGAIARAPDAWLEAEAALGRARLQLSREGSLKRLPKGFEDQAQSPVAEALKLRSYHAWRAIPAESLCADALVDEAVHVARGALSLLQFGWSAFSGR
ncbi:MAG TPA: DUF2461 domain-containing protein [Caulobacteraceae bacterium]|jgi:uncharacterized protein (TIGR02453 family)|nr:DUF2461 domain-containing protein [Caulobacteraceae bacterium]